MSDPRGCTHKIIVLCFFYYHNIMIIIIVIIKVVVIVTVLAIVIIIIIIIIIIICFQISWRLNTEASSHCGLSRPLVRLVSQFAKLLFPFPGLFVKIIVDFNRSIDNRFPTTQSEM